MVEAQAALDAGLDGGANVAEAIRDEASDGGLDGAALGDAPPRVLFLPIIDLTGSGSSAARAGAVEATLLVALDGTASLEACSDPACAELERGLAKARFEPARIAGQPRAARVRVRFVVRVVAASDAGHVGVDASMAATADAGSMAATSDEYGAVATVTQTPPTAHALELAELRELPGAFGDPFRALEALPGVVPVVSGLPYVYVRGAPPAATVYYYDDVQMPALFHLALGPAVVHPAMVGPIDFYPGVAPARYGRKTGGVVAGQAAHRPLQKGLHGELELRLIDMQAYVATPLPNGGRLEFGARYGYPGLLTKLFEPRSVVQYWDYQARASTRLAADTDLTLVVLGSYDMVGERKGARVKRSVEMQFHRLEARVVTRRRSLEVGYALGGGIERSGLEDDFEVQAVRIGPRFWLSKRLAKAQLRVGADMLASYGKLADPLEEDPDEKQRVNLDDQTFQEPPRRSVQEKNPIYASATTRNVIGAYVELLWPFAARWQAEVGLRADLWLTGGEAQGAVEPRLLLRRELSSRVSVHAAGGLGYQPAVFLIPLPGIADVALDRGLQRAIQSELGVSLELPLALTAEAKVYAHFYDRMLSFEAIEDDDHYVCTDSGCEQHDDSDFARLSAYSYGTELLLRRAYRERISGWLAYTLSKADGRTEGGRDITPNFDVRHVGNLVLQWRINKYWHVSLRGYGQSGRFPFGASSELDPRQRRRLPPFFRGDLQISRLWQRGWGELRVSFDWLNFTFQREPFGWDCEGSGATVGNSMPSQTSKACKVQYLEFPITIPMLGVRGTY